MKLTAQNGHYNFRQTFVLQDQSKNFLCKKTMSTNKNMYTNNYILNSIYDHLYYNKVKMKDSTYLLFKNKYN